MKQAKETFGQWLARILMEQGLQATELAKRSGVSKQYISNLTAEAGPSFSGKSINPRRDIVAKLAKGLRLPLSQVMHAAGYHLKQEEPATWELIRAYLEELPIERQADVLTIIQALHSKHAGRINSFPADKFPADLRKIEADSELPPDGEYTIHSPKQG